MNSCILTCFLLITLGGISCRAQESEMVMDNKDNAIHKDSAGNILTHKQALELLRTGKYISVPSMNSLMQIETVIRKPRKEDAGKYQTFTDGNTVISTSGRKDVNLKFNLGDTIPRVTVTNFNGERLVLTNNEMQDKNILLIFIKEDDITWREDIQPFVSLLCHDYPNINFVICPSITTDPRLSSLFSNKFLKQTTNLFMAVKEFSNTMEIKTFAFYMTVNKSGKVLAWTPPLPNGHAFTLLRKTLSSLKD